MDAPEATIFGLWAAVLAASLVGSVHCAGMCGALAVFAVTGGGRVKSKISPHVGYHLGRGISYTLLGGAAGGIGAAVDFSGRFLGWQRSAAIIAGAVMVAFGLIAMMQSMNGASKIRFGPRMPKRWTDTVSKAHTVAMGFPPSTRAATIGLLTPLLPCGWLYAFAITSAATANPLYGAGVMASFWIGTLPLMASIAAGAQALTGPLRKRLPVITSAIIIVMGLLTAFGRMNMTMVIPESVAMAGQPSQSDNPIADARARLDTIDPNDMQCHAADDPPTPSGPANEEASR